MIMKAAVITHYGTPDAIKIRDVPKPAPAAGEILIRVHAATVNRTDCGELRPRILGRLLYGLRRPRRQIFGMDVAGVVETVGEAVTSFKPGDRVFGMCPSRSNGAQAEYVCIAESGPIARMPENIAFDETVVCEGAFYANSGLSKFQVGAGHGLGRQGDRGGRHATSGTRQVPRCRPCHRLYGAGFLPHRREIRLRDRGGGENEFLSIPQAAETQGNVHGDRYRTLGAVPAADSLVSDREEQPSAASFAAPR